MVQQVHYSWRRLLRRGLEFHVCTINKSAHTKKVCKHIVVTTIYILIIIILRHQYGYPWHSLAIPSYHPSLPVGLQGYILYQHRAAVRSFKLVILPLLVHVKGSTGVHHLWARPYFLSSVHMSGLSNFYSFRDGWQVAVQLLLCEVLAPGLIQYCSQHSCVVAVKLFLHLFSQRPCSASI